MLGNTVPGPPKSRPCSPDGASAPPRSVGSSGDHRRVLVGGGEGRIVRAQERDHGVSAVRKRHVEPARLIALRHVAAPLPARPDADHVHRAVAHAMVAVAGEILGRELPVAGHPPLVDPPDHLGTALPPVPRVEEEIEVELVAAEVVEERWRPAVPGRPDRPLVVHHLGDLDEAPLAPVELLTVGVLREGHAHQRPVRPVAPPVVRAQELHGVALVVAADLHATVPAGIQEDTDPPGAVAAEDDRLLAHRRHGVVARLEDLALVADEEPGPGEDLLQLLPVDLLAHEDLPADDPGVHVDQRLQILEPRAGHTPLLDHSDPCRFTRRWCRRRSPAHYPSRRTTRRRPGRGRRRPRLPVCPRAPWADAACAAPAWPGSPACP